MFLRKIKSFFSKISLKIALVYSLIFSICFVATLIFLYFHISTYLIKKDRYVLNIKANQVNEYYQNESANGIQNVIEKLEKNNLLRNILLVIVDKNNEEIFQHLPEETTKFEMNKILNLVKNNRNNGNFEKWHIQKINDGEDSTYEIKLFPLKSGSVLAIGESSDERDDLLEKIQFRMFLTLIPSLSFILVFSVVISINILKPINVLSKSIGEVRKGNLKSRVAITGSTDELKDLSIAYNEMLDRIEALIKINAETVDNLAHDLKTPITQSRMASEIAIQSKDHENLFNAAVRNIESSDNILHLIQSVLITSRLDSKSLSLTLTVNNIRNTIESAIDLYKYVAEDKNIKLVNNVNDFELSYDEQLLKQAVVNLIDNSIKYSPEKSTIEILSRIERDYLVLTVKDEGIGIAQEELELVWERLYRSEKSRSTEGHGIGLSIVRSVVNAHGGKINVSSIVNKGSCFEIFLKIS